MNKTYVFDIDGTICDTFEGEYEDSRPSRERIEIVNKLYEQGNTIFFMTARGMGRSCNQQIQAYKELYDFTKNQLDEWGVKYHDLFMGKPAADYYIDDKAINNERFFIHHF